MREGGEARWWHEEKEGRIVCDLCPRDCRLLPDQRGLCFVRRREGNRMVLDAWGRSSGFCLDPIEKKPLYHFYPGSSVLSFGTAGCNLSCQFCQNWDISRAKETHSLTDRALPEEIADAAVRWGAESVAFTYNDPVIFAEYAIDVAKACRERGVRTVAVTAGYIRDAPRRELFAVMDGANVDLKSFSEEFYFRLTGGHLSPVLETLVYLRRETSVWFEITTLLIPGHNDGLSEISELCEWIIRELGPDIPLHFTAFHPDYRMAEIPPTPAQTLVEARKTALSIGLHYVYTGNIIDREGSRTLCPGCRTLLIEREGYRIESYRIDAGGSCPVCHQKIMGRFWDRVPPPSFGNRRIPVLLHPGD
ncbi:MAG: AmmeMemoRadiSam system radical SAM enzyme [Leptospirillia bacterium]